MLDLIKNKKFPKIMGMLDLNLCCFFNKTNSELLSEDLSKGLILLNEGADLLEINLNNNGVFDIYKNKTTLASDKEINNRILPLIKEIKKATNTKISLDVKYPELVFRAVDFGLDIIKENSGCNNLDIISLIANSNTNLILVHTQTELDIFNKNKSIEKSVKEWFELKIDFLLDNGIKQENIILDPGIGYNKTKEENLELLANINEIQIPGFNLSIEIPKKNFINKILNESDTSKNSLYIGLGLEILAALTTNVYILRVDDVKAKVCMFEVLKNILEYSFA